jgi:hypothetical protein
MMQLRDLSSIKSQLATLEQKLTTTTESLTTSIGELRGQQAKLDERVSALEGRAGVQAEPGGFGRLEERLEMLERARLGSELIIFGAKESPSEKLREVNIGLTIGVTTAPDDIEGCFRIRANGNRPRPIVVRLSSNGVRNRWLAGKRSKGALDGLEVPGLSSGIVEVNERLTAAARAMLGEARRAVRNGQLQHTWVRDGSILVRREPGTSPVRLRGCDHLHSLIPGASIPPATSAPLGGARGGAHSSGVGVAPSPLQDSGSAAGVPGGSAPPLRWASRTDLRAIPKNPMVVSSRNK